MIKHLHMKGLTPKEIKPELDNVHSTSALAFAIVYNRPIEAATPEIIDKITWIHYFTSETKEYSEEGEDREVGQKDDGHSFLGCMRYNSYHYFPSKQTISGDYYAALLDHIFNNILEKKHPYLAKKKVLFHQDNAWVHTCPAPMVKFNEFRYKLLPYPAYSPDLAPCDYFLFPNLKKWFGGKRVTTREHLIETEAYFEGFDKSYYSNSLKKLENRWIKCIELTGDYVEK
ncbi:SETMR methyltransferase, partial [Acromyrmex heyeri]